MNTILENLQTWYAKQCNDDWEHQYGIKIDTLDNPGWSLKVDLKETSLEYIPFKEVELNRSDVDWVFCRIQNTQFQGFGGPGNLSEIIQIFLDWSGSYPG